MVRQPRNPLTFIPVSNLTEVRQYHPQGALSVPTPAEDIQLARALDERMQIHKVQTRDKLDAVARGEIILDRQGLGTTHGLMDLLGVIHHADEKQDTDYYKPENNKILVPKGYEPIESFGSRNFRHMPYENTGAYQADVKSGKFQQDLEVQIRDENGAPVHHHYDKRFLKDEAKKVNIGPKGYINHQETGLQAAAFMNREKKVVIIGIAGLNFEKNELKDAILDGGKRQFEAMRDEVRELLTSDDIPDDYEIVITGHSMGAAVSQRLIYDLKEDQGFRNHDIRAINFDAPQVGNQIDGFDPHLVKPEECVNVNFTHTMGRIDFSKLPGKLYGGGHVGGGFYELDPNFASSDTAQLTEKGKELYSTKLKFARGMVNHQMVNGIEAVVDHHLTTGKEIPFVQTAEMPERAQQQSPERSSSRGIDENGFVSISKDEVYGPSR